MCVFIQRLYNLIAQMLVSKRQNIVIVAEGTIAHEKLSAVIRNSMLLLHRNSHPRNLHLTNSLDQPITLRVKLLSLAILGFKKDNILNISSAFDQPLKLLNSFCAHGTPHGCASVRRV